MYAEHGIEKTEAVCSVKLPELIIGQTYTIKAQNYGMEFTKRTWGGDGKAEKPVRMELIDLYPNFARFRRKAGYTESFSYWDLARRLLHG